MPRSLEMILSLGARASRPQLYFASVPPNEFLS